MNHQPYESWILEEEKLERSQHFELEEHLKVCPQCNKLQQSWSIAKMQIKSAPVKQPEAGFAHRFQASLAKRKREAERRQTRILIFSLVGSAVLILIVMSILFLPRISIIAAIVSCITTLVSISTGISAFVELASSLLHASSPTTLILAAVFLSSLISVITFVWGVTLWRMSLKGVKEHEKE